MALPLLCQRKLVTLQMRGNRMYLCVQIYTYFKEFISPDWQVEATADYFVCDTMLLCCALCFRILFNSLVLCFKGLILFLILTYLAIGSRPVIAKYLRNFMCNNFA